MAVWSKDPAFHPSAFVKPQGLEGARFGIDDPVKRNAVLGVEVALGDAVVGRVGRREDFADPIGAHVDRALIPRILKPLAAPSGDVGAHDVVGAQPNVHLEEDPPATGAAPVVIVFERAADEASKRPLNSGVSRQRGGEDVERAVRDFRSHVVREAEEILVSR